MVELMISSGTGPKECGYAVARVKTILEKEAAKQGFQVSCVREEAFGGPGPLAFRWVILSVKGLSANTFVSSWLGTILWIGDSRYRLGHRRRNWYIGVSLHQSVVETPPVAGKIVFKPQRSSGPGGQNVNKRSTAVRAIDLASGISALAQESRSHRQNKASALRKLQKSVELRNLIAEEEILREDWTSHQLTRQTPVKVFHQDQIP